MNDAALVVAGVVLPPVVSLIKNVGWPTRVKFLLSVAASFAVTSIILALQGEFHSVNDYLAKVSLTWASSQVVYAMFFQDTAVNAKLELASILPKKDK